MVEGAHFANWRFWTHPCLDLGGWHGQLPHSYQAVCRSRECEHPTHFVNSPMPNVAQWAMLFGHAKLSSIRFRFFLLTA